MLDMIQKGLNAKRESKYVEFKSSFDPNSAQQWCELIKDIVAMANTGGGIIMFGLTNTGIPIGFDSTQVLGIDSATITDKIYRYCGYHFAEFEIIECEKDSTKLAALRISPVSIPLIFEKPGTYSIGGGHQRTAFSKGTVYFRHGAKSEPGCTDDIRKVVERQIESIRRSWLQGVRKVVEAPRGAQVTVVGTEVVESKSPTAAPIRIVDDPEAPGYQIIDPDITHPYRQKELIKVVNQKLPKEVTFNSYDALCVRKVYGISMKKEFCHHPKFGSCQYREAYVDWIVNQFHKNNGFFSESREKYFAGDY